MKLHFCNKCGNYRPINDSGECTECALSAQSMDRPPVEFEVVIEEKQIVTEEMKQAAIDKFKKDFGIT